MRNRVTTSVKKAIKQKDVQSPSITQGYDLSMSLNDVYRSLVNPPRQIGVRIGYRFR